MTIFDVINLAGGIALFLYGMSIMGSGLEKIAGGKMESILQKLTASTLRAVLLGAIITGIIQSSAGTTVIVIGLVNSGIMQLSQGIGIIMGANIGTTVTGQLIRLSEMSGTSTWMEFCKPDTFAPLVAFAGAILFVFIKAPKKRNIGQIMMGFGLLFTGMGIMTSSVEPLRDSPLFVQLFTSLQNPLLGVLAGMLVTVAIQSSSASVGILQALSSTGVVTWGSAIPIILGQNIGTCSTPLIASVGASKAAKRSAVVHLYFNVIGSLVFMVVIYGLKALLHFDWWDKPIGMGDIANFHTLFNVVVTVMFIPFVRLLAKLAEMTIPDTEDERTEIEMPVLDERLLTSPAVAIQQAKSAVETMARNAQMNYAASIPVLYSHDAETLNLIHQRENMIDQLEVAISNYLVKITDKELSENESHAVSELLNFVVEYERIGDYAINVCERSGEMFDKELSFTDSAKAELALVDKALQEILDITLRAFEQSDVAVAEQVEPLEETIDLMIEFMRTRHIRRLKGGECQIDSGTIYMEILTNLERISDHCSNIAARIVGSEEDVGTFDAHAFRRNMHDGFVPNFNEMLAQYKEKYYEPLCKV
ncbi:Na/Pi cotransporter family protein [uncultured Ruthenibacterium sp.]|uniref:Na/Pi cotransporter family protein n=1 Tax=uncultured Ruthenibacterium sp. TaxID=1905347 RepID=UPI00349EFB44